MARRQVIVQLDDAMLAELDRAAKTHGLNRSEIIRQSVKGFLQLLREEEWDRQHAAAYRKQPQELDVVQSIGMVAQTWPPYET